MDKELKIENLINALETIIDQYGYGCTATDMMCIAVDALDGVDFQPPEPDCEDCECGACDEPS